MAGELNLTVRLHRPVYPSLTAPQQAYVLLEAAPPASESGAGTQPVNFSLVLDRSGSMAGEKLRQMKMAAQLVVDHLGPQDILSVVVFDETADVIIPCGPVQDHQAIKDKIAAIQERGGTHMSTGMQAGYQEMQRGLGANRVSNMLLLADGQTWEDQAQCESLADQCRAAGAPIFALGLGVGVESNWDPRLLEDLAQRSGGEWTVVDAPEKVGAVFESQLRAMQGTIATNATLTMRMVQGVMPRTVWRVKPLISRLGHQSFGLQDVQVFLGDIQYGMGQAVMADVLFPPRKPGSYRLIQADITYDVPSSGLTRQKTSLDVVVQFDDEAAAANQVDQAMMNTIERVVAHRLQTQALDDVAAGEVVRATQRLRAAATRLLEIGEPEMAEQASQQAAQIEQVGQIDPAVAQKMRYATKKLTEAELVVEAEAILPVEAPEVNIQPEALSAPEEEAPVIDQEMVFEEPAELQLAPEDIAPQEDVQTVIPEMDLPAAPEVEMAAELQPEVVSEAAADASAEQAEEIAPEMAAELPEVVESVPDVNLPDEPAPAAEMPETDILEVDLPAPEKTEVDMPEIEPPAVPEAQTSSDEDNTGSDPGSDVQA